MSREEAMTTIKNRTFFRLKGDTDVYIKENEELLAILRFKK